MPVDRHPQIEHDPLAGELQRPRLDVFGRERRDEDDEIQRREPIEAFEAPGRNVPVDCRLDQVGLRERRGRPDDDRDEGDPDLPPVRPQILQQPPHQARVVGFAEDLVVVHLVITRLPDLCYAPVRV